MPSAKDSLRRVLPAPLLKAVRKYVTGDPLAAYSKLSTKEAFTKIYEQGVWGQSTDPDHKYFSGTGSHDDAVVAAYVGAVEGLLKSFDKKPNVVDLGCGDFYVGARVRHLCGHYTACDIVESLIEFNKSKYKYLDVDFRVADLAQDVLPPAEIVFIRQVLQHLSNAQIQRALPQIVANYKYLVLTEHLPNSAQFKPNVDKLSGPDTRLALRSGVVLTARPFNLPVTETRLLCQVPQDNGVIVTTLYRLAV